MIINGITTKEKFPDFLNGKKFLSLTKNFKEFISLIFPDVSENDIINCIKSNGKNINLVISINGIFKNISIKTGSVSVLKVDYLDNLMLKLVSFGASKRAISLLLNYLNLEGDYITDDNDIIALINKELSSYEVLMNLIDYFLINDSNDKKVHYFYYGNIRRGFVISSEKLKENILDYQYNINQNYLKIGPFNISIYRQEGQWIYKVKVHNFLKFFN